MPARLTKPPQGHRHRLSQAEHRPDRPGLLPSDVAVLISLSVTAVYDRDAELRPSDLGRRGKRARRYSYAAVMAYLDRQKMGADVGVPATA